MKTGRIYKIIPNEGTEIYVGSTFNRLSDRFRSHKANYKGGKESNFCSVFEIFKKYGIDGCEIILIKEYEVVDRKHLSVYETLWIKKLKTINQLEPSGGLLKKQWFKHYGKKYREDNKELIRQKKKEDREKNKEKVATRSKIYREENKERIKEKKKRDYEKNGEKMRKQKRQNYRENKEKFKERDKKYYEKNKEKIAVKKKQFYEQNKHHILEKIQCECGSVVAKSGFSKHKITKKHQDYLKK
jgi:hypothetical protein